MFEEITKAVRTHFSERMTSPLAGAFAFSWSAWNYRLFIVIFSGESVESKFNLIDKYIFPSICSYMTNGLFYPLATALSYIFIYPYPSKMTYSFNLKKQREILEIRRKIEEETPLTLEDSRRIRSDIAVKEQSFYEELDRKEREIDRLKSQLASQIPDVGSKQSSQEQKFLYQPYGRSGRNILSDTTHDVKAGEDLSLEAKVPTGKKLHVVLHGPPPQHIDESSGAWHYSISGIQNWKISKYQENPSGCIQHFNAEEGMAEMTIFFSRDGQFTIEVFEGESRVASWRKIISVSGNRP